MRRRRKKAREGEVGSHVSFGYAGRTKLPLHLEIHRTRIVCAADAPTYTESLQYSEAYALSGFDNSLCLSSFCKNFHVEIISSDDDNIEFDMIGIDAAIGNALRRILIAEIKNK